MLYHEHAEDEREEGTIPRFALMSVHAGGLILILFHPFRIRKGLKGIVDLTVEEQIREISSLHAPLLLSIKVGNTYIIANVYVR